MKEINDIKNKKLNLIEVNPINNLKKKFSSEGKKEDLSKSDVNLNDNNDIVIFKKKSKYSINLKKIIIILIIKIIIINNYPKKLE